MNEASSAKIQSTKVKQNIVEIVLHNITDVRAKEMFLEELD